MHAFPTQFSRNPTQKLVCRRLLTTSSTIQGLTNLNIPNIISLIYMSTHHQEELPGAHVWFLHQLFKLLQREHNRHYIFPKIHMSNTLSATNSISVGPQIWSHGNTCCNRATFEFYKTDVMPISHKLGAKQKQLRKTYLHKCLWWNWWQCQVSCRLGFRA